MGERLTDTRRSLVTSSQDCCFLPYASPRTYRNATPTAHQTAANVHSSIQVIKKAPHALVQYHARAPDAAVAAPHTTAACSTRVVPAIMMSSMARPRPVETWTFVLVLGTLLAGRGGIEAVAPFQSGHVQHTRHGGAGSAHRRGGAAAEAAAAAVAAELVLYEKKDATTTTTNAPLRGGAQQSLGLKIAAALRGGRSMRQTAGEEDQESQQEEEEEQEEDEMMTGEEEDEEQEEEGEVEPVLYDEKAVEWMMQQLCMYQTRTALISNPLAEKVHHQRYSHTVDLTAQRCDRNRSSSRVTACTS